VIVYVTIKIEIFIFTNYIMKVYEQITRLGTATALLLLLKSAPVLAAPDSFDSMSPNSQQVVIEAIEVCRSTFRSELLLEGIGLQMPTKGNDNRSIVCFGKALEGSSSYQLKNDSPQIPKILDGFGADRVDFFRANPRIPNSTPIIGKITPKGPKSH
jgi:hypothetical protein